MNQAAMGIRLTTLSIFIRAKAYRPATQIGQQLRPSEVNCLRPVPSTLIAQICSSPQRENRIWLPSGDQDGQTASSTSLVARLVLRSTK